MDVVRRLQSAGYVAYWAGGCVRDRLLGKEPHDYDVATNALPDAIRELFGRSRTLAIGAAFGVISVLGPRGVRQVEVATFRRDAAYSDGRHPDSVAFSTAEIDAQRRDFTINGLFFDPVADCVIDFVGGESDLRSRLVRAIGDPTQRLDEDKLRMLRAVRFTATLGFDLDPATLIAVQRLRAELVIVSAERIAAEMERILIDPHRVRGLELLRESGLLQIVVPETAPLLDRDDDPTWMRTLSILEHLCEPTFGMAIAALVRECRPNQPHTDLALSVGGRWRLSLEVTKQMQWLLKHEAKIRTAPEQSWPTLQRILVGPYPYELLDFSQAVAEVIDPSLEAIQFCRERLAWPEERLNPKPLVTGDDLIEAGLRPGPQFRIVLDQVRDAQLLGQIASKQQALELAAKLATR